MQAIRVHAFGDTSVMKLEETPVPGLGASQILVRVAAVGVNPVDTYIRSGMHAHKPHVPYTPGSDGAGIVEETQDLLVPKGSRVYFGRALTGSYAQFAVCERRSLFPLPDTFSFEQGAALFVPYFTAYRALVHRARASSGQWVFIHGASGGVGLAAIQIARSLGCRVIGTAGTPHGLDLVRRQGAEVALNHREPGYLDAIRALTGYPTGGVHAIVEMLANVNLDKDLGVLAPGGCVVVVGNRGRIEIDPRQTMTRESTIYGTSLFNAPAAEMEETAGAMHAGLLAGLFKPVVRCALPLADAPRAHELVMEPGAAGKIVLRPW